ARFQERQISQQGIQRPDQRLDLLPSFSPRPVGLGYFEQLGMLPAAQSRIENGQGMVASGAVTGEIETARPTHRALAQPRHQSPLRRLPVRMMLGQILFNLLGGKR